MYGKKIKYFVLFFVISIVLAYGYRSYASARLISSSSSFIFYWGFTGNSINEFCSTADFYTDWSLNDYITEYRKACRERDNTLTTDPEYMTKLENVEKIVAAWDYYISCLNRFGINSKESKLLEYNAVEKLVYDPNNTEAYYRNLYYYNIAKRDMLIVETKYFKQKYSTVKPYLFEEYVNLITVSQNEEINKAIFLYDYYMKDKAGSEQ